VCASQQNKKVGATLESNPLLSNYLLLTVHCCVGRLLLYHHLTLHGGLLGR
jgi:hypothetical protein